VARKPDFGKTAADYARFRAGFPSELFDRLREKRIGLAGQRVLDLGAGAGVVGRALARFGCLVTDLDPSAELLAEARRLDAEAGLNLSYVQATAEETGLPAQSFDVVTAAVCWHWFDSDRAAREVLRILAPGGSLAIIAFDWLALPGTVAADTEQLMQEVLPSSPGRRAAKSLFLSLVSKLKPEWVRSEGSGVHPDRLTVLGRHGFERLESFSFDVDAPYSHEAWRGRLRSHAAVGASKSGDVVERFDAALAEMLRRRHPGEPMAVPHRVFVVIGRAPGTAPSNA
jgi:SAM-dependent methyltransferase